MRGATSAEVQRAQKEVSPIGSIGDEIDRTVQHQLANAAPERAPTPAQIASNAKYLFRTDPGNRCVVVRIPGVPSRVCSDPELNEKRVAYFERQFAKKYPQAERERFAKVAEEVGDLLIPFSPVARKQESKYETNSRIVAEFLREKIANGELPMVYEDAPNASVSASPAPAHRTLAAVRLKESRGE